MDKEALKVMSYDDVRRLYKQFLLSQDIGPNTVNTAYADSFYLWRNGDHDLFWAAVEADDATARDMLIDVLSKKPNVDVKKVVNPYLSQLRRFRLFLASEGVAALTSAPAQKETATAAPVLMPAPAAPGRRTSSIDVPLPSVEQVEHYLREWDALENYRHHGYSLEGLYAE